MLTDLSIRNSQEGDQGRIQVREGDPGQSCKKLSGSRSPGRDFLITFNQELQGKERKENPKLITFMFKIPIASYNAPTPVLPIHGAAKEASLLAASWWGWGRGDAHGSMLAEFYAVNI